MRIPYGTQEVIAYANIAIAFFTFLAAIAAAASARVMRRASKATAIDLLQKNQATIHDANVALTRFVRTHREDFILRFQRNVDGAQDTLGQHLREITGAFVLAWHYRTLKLLKKREVVRILPKSSAQVLIQIVEPMERTLHPGEYDRGLFRMMMDLYGVSRFSGFVDLFGERMRVRYPADWYEFSS